MTDLTDAVEKLKQGGVIAYPTESCFGLGCDPDNQAAVEKILNLKQRDVSKGLILIASSYSQLLPYIDDLKIPQDKRFSVLSYWPGPFTLLLPVRSTTPKFLTGQFDTLAVRVTDHPTSRALCEAYGKPIVSTSANLAGQPSATQYQAVVDIFKDDLAYIVNAPIGSNPKPSTILNPLTGEQFR